MRLDKFPFLKLLLCMLQLAASQNSPIDQDTSAGSHSNADVSSDMNIPINDHDNFVYYAVQIKRNSLSEFEIHEKARSLSDSLDFHFIHRVGQLEDTFLYAKTKRDTEPNHLHKRLESHPEVEWVEQQILRKRLFKRISPATKPSLDDFRTKLAVNDPDFDKQWHLVPK